MDKFGFFKLLNSFLTPSNAENQPQNEKSNDVNNVLSDLISSLNKENSQPNAPKNQTPPENKNLNPPHPLQSLMLSTMSSHDEFIKRVQSNAKKSPN